MLSLPPVVGRYAVGATAFVTPVRPSRVYGSAKRRKVNGSSLEHVLSMEEVGVTVYYPADISSADRKGFDWLLR
jgi:platelet-activating factor acetylhydrolase